MRDPSIHIKESDLFEILEDYKKLFPGSTFHAFTQDLMMKCKKRSCSHRSMVATNQKQRKKIEQLEQSHKSDADLVAKIIYATRIKLKHRGVKQIKENDRDWPLVKELANLCNQFCTEFNMTKREGYIKYIETGLGKLKSMRAHLSKLVSMYDSLCQDIQAASQLVGDNAAKALAMHDTYIAMIASRTGIYESYKDQPATMMAFAEAAELCERIGIDFDTFMEAQFEALAFCNGIPLPNQLYGDKATERLNKYLFKHNVSINKPTENKADWNKILGA